MNETVLLDILKIEKKVFTYDELLTTYKNQLQIQTRADLYFTTHDKIEKYSRDSLCYSDYYEDFLWTFISELNLTANYKSTVEFLLNHEHRNNWLNILKRANLQNFKIIFMIIVFLYTYKDSTYVTVRSITSNPDFLRLLESNDMNLYSKEKLNRIIQNNIKRYNILKRDYDNDGFRVQNIEDITYISKHIPTGIKKSVKSTIDDKPNIEKGEFCSKFNTSSDDIRISVEIFYGSEKYKEKVNSLLVEILSLFNSVS